MKMFVVTEWQDGMKIVVGWGIEKSILDPLFDEVPHAFCMLVYILSVLLHSTNLTLIDFDVYKSFL